MTEQPPGRFGTEGGARGRGGRDGGERRSRPLHVLRAALLGVFVALVLGLVSAVDRTADEFTYIGASGVIAVEGWTHPSTLLHGPLPFYANRIFFDPGLPGVLDEDDSGDRPELYRRARLGMLPFAILTALLVAAWARRLWGPWGGVGALALFVAHPLMAAYGALVAVDMAYAAGVVASLFAAWAYVRRPAPARAALVGSTVGLSLATKYLALLTAPVPLLAVAIAAWRARGAWRACRDTALAGAIALGTLWASYGFRVDGAPGNADEYVSHLRAVAEAPGGGLLLGLLPEPWARGVDYQWDVGSREYSVYLRGRFAPGHLDYYLWALLQKTPEWMIALFAVGIAVGVASLRRGPPRADLRAALWVTAPAITGLLIYLSAFTSLQLGVRYVLPVFPILAVWLAGLVPRALELRSRRAAIVVGAVLAVVVPWTAVDLARQWPNWLSYANTLSGGPRESWRLFNDSNTDWGQTRRTARELLEERGDVELLASRAGPRLGRVAVELRDFLDVDPEDPTRPHHWVDVFEPVEVAGTAWYVFDIDPAAWEAEAERRGDDRARHELAIALAGDDLVEDAERVADSLGESGSWADFARRTGSRRALVRARAWIQVRRGDRALEALDSLTGPDPAGDYVRARALAIEGRKEEAEAVLARGDDASPQTLAYHVRLLRTCGRPEEALERICARLDDFGEEERRAFEPTVEALERVVADRATLRRVLDRVR